MSLINKQALHTRAETERETQRKMFRLHKNRPSKSQHKLDFNFSQFKVLQVPEGWDKLFVSIISRENVKSLAKSSKAIVRNGSCQWTDSISHSILVSRDNASKDIEDCLLKLVVATGSSRSSILGEATVNMASYMSSTDAIPLSIPLNKCNHGTVLHVTVQCLTPKIKFRDQESRQTNSDINDLNAKNHDVAVKSIVSDCSIVESVESSSIKVSDSTSSLGAIESRETNFSGCGSHCSYTSTDGSTGKGNLSPSIDSRDDEQSPGGMQDSSSSLKSVSDCNYHAHNFSSSNNSSSNSQTTILENLSSMQVVGLSPMSTATSKSCQEGPGESTEELRAEAKMWEMNARKLMVDLETLRAEFSDQSKNVTHMELSAAQRDDSKDEIEQLKLPKKHALVYQKESEVSNSQDEYVLEIERALQDELKFQKESNANLSSQLAKSQEANIQLVSVLQELEGTIEQQKMEIKNLSALPSKFNDLENSFQLSIEENRSLRLQLEQMEESKNELLVKMQQLELVLEEKHDIEIAKFSDMKEEYERKLSAKEEETFCLKTKLLESLPKSSNAETESRNADDEDLRREIEVLKENIQELETDCNELTNENLELIFKLKEAQKELQKGGTPENFSPNKLVDQCFVSSETDVKDKVFPMLHLEDVLQEKAIGQVYNNNRSSSEELEGLKIVLEGRIAELNKKVIDKASEIENLEATLSSKEKEIEVLHKCQSEFETKACNLEDDKNQLQEQVEVMQKERDLIFRCLNHLLSDMAALSGSTDSHTSSENIFERKPSEKEKGKHDPKLNTSEIEQVKEQLSQYVSDLEAQIRDLKSDRESILSELRSSKSHAATLQGKIMKIKSEMEFSKEDTTKRLKEIRLKWSDAQQDCEYLRRENQQLEAVIENLSTECNSLQKSNGDLKSQELELKEHLSIMRIRLGQSDQSFAECLERVNLLEKRLTLMYEDNTSTEKSIASELDVLLGENGIHREKEKSLLNQLHEEKSAEIQNLQQEIDHLKMKLSDLHDEKERIASNTLIEMSALHAEKAKLQSDFKEVQSVALSYKNEVDVMQKQYERRLQDLTTELSASKINQEMLMSDHEELSKIVDDYKSRELKVKSAMNTLELKLEVTEHEKQQLMEETKYLRIELQQIDQLKNEIILLKKDLDSTSYEKKRLEASLLVTSELCENLKAEVNLSATKILSMEKEVSELEDCKRSRATLKERLVQMESDLKTRELSFAQVNEKNELNQIKRINRQHQQTIQALEQEKVELQTKFRASEEELKLSKEQKRNQMPKMNRKAVPVPEDLKILKNPMVKNSSQHRNNRKKPLSKNDRETLKNQQDISNSKHQSEVETDHGLHDESVHVVEVDPESKIQLLEAELAKAKEAINVYEVQLNRLLSKGQNNQANVSSVAGGEVVTREKFERTKSMLEAELRDIQERYLNMSLKYAEVEGQREELVMKLRLAKKNKK